MPHDRYRLQKQRGSRNYFVVSKKTGRKFSKKALPKSRARRQQQALYAAQRRSFRGGTIHAGHWGCGCGRCPYMRGGCGCGGSNSASKTMYGGCSCGTSGGKSPDYTRALALGAASGLLTGRKDVGLGVGLGSVAFDLVR
jgi:hypothetical protein